MKRTPTWAKAAQEHRGQRRLQQAKFCCKRCPRRCKCDPSQVEISGLDQQALKPQRPGISNNPDKVSHDGHGA